MEAPNPLLRHLPALLLEARDISHILTQAEAPVNGDEPTTKTVPVRLSVTDGQHNDVVPLAKNVTVLTRNEPRRRSSCRSWRARGTCCTINFGRLPHMHESVYTPSPLQYAGRALSRDPRRETSLQQHADSGVGASHSRALRRWVG